MAVCDSTTHRQIIYRLRVGSRGRAARLQGIVDGCRYVWNRSLGETRDAMGARAVGEETAQRFEPKPSVSFQSLGLRVRLYRAEQPWLRELPMAEIRYALKYQSEAWQRCFKGGGRPRFKSRHREGSFTIPQLVRIRAGRLWIPKTGWYRLVGSNPYPDGKPVKVVVKQELGRWYAVVCYRVAEPERPDNGMAVGVDMNHAPRAVAVSTGDIVPFPDTARLEARKRRYQRVMARRRKGSNRRAVARRRAAKAHRRLRGIRRDWQHQTSRTLARTAGMVVYEDLRVSAMSRKGRGKRGLNRENLKPGWAGLRTKIEYKAAHPTAVTPHYTSQTCVECGTADSRSRDGEDFRCVACGHCAHADINAALNILARGVRASGTEVRATGRRGATALAAPMNRQYMPMEV